ncbi:MAG: hypothetical protein Q7R57_04110 [Dehalococcoidales bacterium]|nr:hypothetical protein [Dehalococcoidales bacterium]
MDEKKTLKSRQIELPDSLEDVYEFVMKQGWGDGLPIIPPTQERVYRMIEHSGKEPDEVIASIAPLEGEATIEKIAINAVMAGCKPEYMPVVIAAVEAMAAPEFHLGGLQTTTNPVTALAIINGPIRHKIDVNCAVGCMGPGWRANATIGRAMRLIMLNIGGGVPDKVSRSLHGFPGRYSFCFGEYEEGNPWSPLHVERGFDKNTSTVTVVGAQATHNVITIVPDSKLFLRLAADSMSTLGNNNMVFTEGEPLIVITSAHAEILARDGFTKQTIKEFLFESCGVPVSQYPREIATPSKDLFVANGKVKPCEKPEDIMVVVTGAPNPYHLVVIPTFGDTTAVTMPIRGA